MADRCDILTDRLTALELLGEEVTAALGEEITRLRAEVLHLAGLVASLDDPRNA